MRKLWLFLFLLITSTSQATITFHAFDSRGNTATTSVGFVVGGAGASFSTNDLCLVAVSINTNTTITPPDGTWTIIRTLNNTNLLLTQYAYKYNCGAGTYTWTFGVNSTSNGAVMTITGVDPSTVIDVENGQTNISSANQDAPSITTTIDNDMLVGCWAAISSSGTWSTNPSGMTRRWQRGATTSGSCATIIQTPPGATGTKTSTVGVAGIGMGELIALLPAASTPTNTPTNTNTPTPTRTPTFSPTSTFTFTPTDTPTFTATATPTTTSTITPTPLNTPTNTFTNTPTSTGTNTPTTIPTTTPTITPTLMPTSTVTPTPNLGCCSCTSCPPDNHTVCINNVVDAPTCFSFCNDMGCDGGFTAGQNNCALVLVCGGGTSTPTITSTGTPTRTPTRTHTAFIPPGCIPTQTVTM